MQLNVSPAPRSTPLFAGLQEMRAPEIGWRPQGTRDWLLLHTLSGHGRIRCEGREFALVPGVSVLIAPDTPQDYGLDQSDGHWTNIWVHFHIRSDWAPHLAWPELAPGTGWMSYPDDLRQTIEVRLHDLVRQFQGPGRLSREFAMNTLEAVLLMAAEVNPDRIKVDQDPRIRHAMHLISEGLTGQVVIADLARSVGLSRTRFSVLFKDRVGCTPQDYLESKRLERVADLLSHTSMPLGRIAEQTGFACAYYLSRRFSRRYRTSPSDYRAQSTRNG